MKIKSKASFWIYYKLKNKGKFWKILNEQIKAQHYPIGKLEEIQFNKLRRLIEHTYSNVQLYRDMMEAASVKPSDIKNTGDIEKLPIITKTELREGFPDKVIAQNLPKSRFILDKTSGTINQPLEFYKDKNDELNESCARFRWLINAGYKLGEKRILIKGEKPKDSNVDSRYSRLKFISAFGMNEKEFDKWFDFLVKFKPTTIESFPSPLVSFSNYLKKNNKKLNVPIIITLGEMLTKENRKLIEERFNGKIYDSYGCSEAMYIAQECDTHNGLHYDMCRFLVEFVNNNDKGVKEELEGDVLITNLDNYVMPIIRYKVGDMAILSSKKCVCGSNFPKIKEIKGRIVDQLKSPSGKILDLPYFATIFEDEVRYVRHFQIIQKGKRYLLIKIVFNSKKEENKQVISRIKKKITDYVDKGMKIEISPVDEIPLGRTGKRIFIKSEVK